MPVPPTAAEPQRGRHRRTAQAISSDVVYLTGGSGFLGGAVVEALAPRKIYVPVRGKGRQTGAERFAALPVAIRHPNCVFVPPLTSASDDRCDLRKTNDEARTSRVGNKHTKATDRQEKNVHLHTSDEEPADAKEHTFTSEAQPQSVLLSKEDSFTTGARVSLLSTRAPSEDASPDGCGESEDAHAEQQQWRRIDQTLCHSLEKEDFSDTSRKNTGHDDNCGLPRNLNLVLEEDAANCKQGLPEDVTSLVLCAYSIEFHDDAQKAIRENVEPMLQLLEEAVVLERRSPGQLRSVVVVSTAYVLPYREPASSRHASTTVEQNENDKPHREEVQASSTPASTFSGAARPSSCALADERKQDALVADEDGGRGISPTKTRPRRTGDCSINSQPKKSTFTADHQSQPSTQRVSNLVSVGGAASSSSSSSSSCSRGNVRSPDITRGSTFLIPPLPTACGSKGVDNPFLIPPLPTARGSKGVDMLWLYEEVLHGRLTLATVRKHRWLHPQSTENAYIFSKTLAEHIIVDRFAKDLPLTFLRPSIISCSVDGEMGSRAAPFCGLKLLAHAGLLPRFWGGRGTLDTVHVDEVARRVAELTESVPPEKRKTTGTADITREQSRSGGQKGHPRMYFATSGSGITPRELREILQPRNRVWVLDSSSTSSTSATTSRSSSCSQKKKTHETVVTGKADTERASFDQACEQKHLKKNFLAGFISSWHPAPWASATITTMLSQISGKNATKTSSHNFFFSTKNMCLQQLVSCASSWFSVLWLLRAVECFVCWCFYGSKYATKLHQTYRNYDSFTLRDFDFPHTLPVEKRQLQKSLDVFANRFFKERENKQKSTRMKQEDTTDEERMKE